MESYLSVADLMKWWVEVCCSLLGREGQVTSHKKSSYVYAPISHNGLRCLQEEMLEDMERI